MARSYHVEVNSIYVELVRIRYSCQEYFKAWLRYKSKASGAVIAEERSVKIRRSIFRFWKEWHGQ